MNLEGKVFVHTENYRPPFVVKFLKETNTGKSAIFSVLETDNVYGDGGSSIISKKPPTIETITVRKSLIDNDGFSYKGDYFMLENNLDTVYSFCEY